MNEIINRCLLTGDRLMPKMHLILIYSACEPFSKNKEWIQNLKKQNRRTGDSRYIYQSELDKGCFQLDANHLLKNLKNEKNTDVYR